MLLFSILGLVCALKFKRCTRPFSVQWWLWLILASMSFTCCLWYGEISFNATLILPDVVNEYSISPFSVKYIGIYSCFLGLLILIRSYWNLLCNPKNSFRFLFVYFVLKLSTVIISCASVYLLVFYLHLSHLSKAGPHDSIMTSAFQASLEVSTPSPCADVLRK